MILLAQGEAVYRVKQARLVGPGRVVGMFRRAEDVIDCLRGAKDVPHMLAPVALGERVSPDASDRLVVYCGPVLYDFFADEVRCGGRPVEGAPPVNRRVPRRAYRGR